MKVYLCGAINGCTDAECKDWREAIKAHFPDAIDPMKRDYRGREVESRKEIVRLDLRDVRSADVLLVNANKPSWGTAMEIVYAHLAGIPVVTWCPADMPISPWLDEHTMAFVHSIDAVIVKLKEIA